MRNSYVGNSTNRKLNVEEFRGFAIADQYAPVIFINAADSVGARIFTLVHELVHIWLGKSGISDTSLDNHHKIEQFCNSIAAEFLVPEDEIKKQWNHNKTLQENLTSLSSVFCVSTWVIARRALELNFINQSVYIQVIENIKSQIKKQNGGANFYATLVNKVSKRFIQAVISEALSGRLLLRDASLLIGAKVDKFKKIAREISTTNEAST